MHRQIRPLRLLVAREQLDKAYAANTKQSKAYADYLRLVNLRYRHDSRYFGPKAALRGGSLFGLKFMLNDVKKEVPFDEETFAHGGMRVFAVATNVETGKPAYFEKGKTDFPFDEAVRASARSWAARGRP